MKVKSDRHSKFSNLSKWKEEAWKYLGFKGIRTGDLSHIGAMLYQLSCEATHCVAERPDRWGHGFESHWSLDIFRLLPFNCLNWKMYCNDHSSLSFNIHIIEIPQEIIKFIDFVLTTLPNNGFFLSSWFLQCNWLVYCPILIGWKKYAILYVPGMR